MGGGHAGIVAFAAIACDSDLPLLHNPVHNRVTINKAVNTLLWRVHFWDVI